MKKLNRLMTSVAALCAMLIVVTACDRDNDIDIPQTSVNRVTETSVTVGDEMTFTGTNMHLITKVLFGEVEAVVDPNLGKRDRNQLTVTVPELTETGNVVLSAIYNTNIKLILSEALEVIVPPVIPTVISALPATVASGTVVELNGTNLHIIKALKVGDVEVDIRSKDELKISFVAPTVEAETTVGVTLIYDNSLGTDQQLVVTGTIVITPAG